MDDAKTVGRRPRLLVSVRSPEEAVAAINGGADVIDIKEPSRGSLGMADPRTISGIIDVLPATVSVSAALGETRDWFGDERTLELSERLDFVKLGTAGLGTESDWVESWKRVQRRLLRESTSGARWIAVGYADWKRYDAPSIESVVDAACDTNAAGVLIDTFDKQSGRLCNHLPAGQLEAVVGQCRQAGLLIALAGRLSVESLPAVVAAHPDLIAVRSVVCTGGDRRSSVDELLVRDAKASIERLCTVACEIVR